MNYKTFKQHMNENLQSLDSFYDKITNFQTEKNLSRAEKARWNEAKVQKAIDNMYEEFFKNIYQQIKMKVEENGKKTLSQWIKFFEDHEAYENIDQSIYEIENE